MQKRFYQILLIVTFALFASQITLAGGSATQTMAKILVNLNHYPSDSEKDALRGIVNNKSLSEQERIIAQAMINLQHEATAADKPKLSKVMNDSSASADVRELAMIVHHLNHKPSGGDVAKLKKMM